MSQPGLDPALLLWPCHHRAVSDPGHPHRTGPDPDPNPQADSPSWPQLDPSLKEVTDALGWGLPRLLPSPPPPACPAGGSGTGPSWPVAPGTPAYAQRSALAILSTGFVLH